MYLPMRKRQLADTNVLIGQYRLLAKRPIFSASLISILYRIVILMLTL